MDDSRVDGEAGAPASRLFADGRHHVADAGLPDDLALSAAVVFERWKGDRDDFDISLADVLAHLRTQES